MAAQMANNRMMWREWVRKHMSCAVLANTQYTHPFRKVYYESGVLLA